MPNETQRTSLTINLATRYAQQSEGGAFNAKTAGTATAPASLQSKLYDTNPQFQVKETLGQSNFEGVTDGGNYKEISRYANNINTTRYK